MGADLPTSFSRAFLPGPYPVCKAGAFLLKSKPLGSSVFSHINWVMAGVSSRAPPVLTFMALRLGVAFHF